ncbi:glycerophosphodiester phosphodiesterase [Allobranchiibius sp. CTAmp26]|uniref:glycerophosphodiester phosphodiesterase n=1 Tax=Allobranchiibius sp. CTAmp26 TaxID=2815214 RepID=UPI001AA1A819|nr:glycerophosphodiester phosphodiesterase [Allobranchiibius sp. CTAmp26]MBO1755396.1 glycerophosphodiester phosphodiesterase [Allobranchiibius sp. CTAmp26]
MAHRGFSRDGLENSMAAFRAAVDLDYAYVETDVHATADGVLVAFHDSSLDRVAGRSGAIVDLPWRDVATARIGGVEPIPRFDELLETWPQLRLNIDCKSDAAVSPLADAIERHRAWDRVCVASFSDRRRRAVLTQLSRPVATTASPVLVGVALAFGRTPLARLPIGTVDCLQIPERTRKLPVLTRTLIRQAHAAGAQVHVWTVDDPAAMHRLLDLGVDGLMTDRGDLLRDVLVSRGQWHVA